MKIYIVFLGEKGINNGKKVNSSNFYVNLRFASVHSLKRMQNFLPQHVKLFTCYNFSSTFYFLTYTIVQRKSIVIVKKFEFEILVELSVLRSPESQKVGFTKCLYVCLHVCMYEYLYVRIPSWSKNYWFDFDQIWYIYVNWALTDTRGGILKYSKHKRYIQVKNYLKTSFSLL